MPWWPPTVGMFFLCRGQTYRVMCRRPRERRHRNYTSSAELRCGSFGNVALDALDEPIKRAGGGLRHRCAGGHPFFTGTFLSMSVMRLTFMSALLRSDACVGSGGSGATTPSPSLMPQRVRRLPVQ